MTKRRLTRRQRQVRRNRIILACASAALLIIIIVIISVSMKGCSKSKKTDKNGESTTAKVEESTQTKENEITSEEVSSTDTSSSIMSDATSVSASSDSSEFAPPVVPSGNTVSKVLLLKASRFRKLMEQLILTEYLLPIRHMLFLRISFPLILTSLLMQTEAQHVLTRLL